MPRRNPSKRLTTRQQVRIDSQREQRRQTLSEPIMDAGLFQKETLSSEEGRVISHFGLNVEVEDGFGARFRCAVRETAGQEPVCGDRVQWSRSGNVMAQGVIWSILERKNALRRPVAGGGVQTVAANIDRLMVTLTADKPNTGLLDRYLVAAEANAMEAVIVVNKTDLVDGEASMAAVFQPYVAMNYPICHVSARTGQGMVELESLLRDRTSMFAGHSGVGKSSIVARWIPDGEKPAIGTIHERLGQGRHTTTVARMYPLPSGGRLIDSPGIREFGLIDVSRETLALYFRDVVSHAQPCRFANCSHEHEPGCGVKEAVATGHIAQSRYDSLLRIFHSLPTGGWS
ncbi:MAG: ribosome small subunit-dependent GTPase A [Magnetococcales bacterium]|nr:ribosome small subunit-dependent GTPase A [Magnetococcales bacterium]MBF0149545.1 ribosome small subunit-dependent GTPase A [Magnetococcales bacterium]MBF0173491.1 ribosome small subunit-dependent GTPase A [Magnetococcales bacterium]MBF0346913.1 ribosome small subunit-dependent GTPase A [Magnetococcales bacterium]MBF0631932.1 ribosome small subunit-dependent GTPase A [Magnetococcales bacterium]